MGCIDSGEKVLDADRLGWRFEECINGEFIMALSMWNNLVAAIVAKLPAQANDEISQRPEDDSEGIIPASILAIPPFVHAVLSQAKRPPFASIAPQLQVPDEAFIHRAGSQLKESYPKASLTTPQPVLIGCPHFLLFPWRTSGVQLPQDNSDRGTLAGVLRYLTTALGVSCP